jgi:cell wall-associated NlpC family hydrolase
MIMIEKFATIAESYLDTPYLHQGRLPGVGLDCAGVVACAAIAAGFKVEDVAGYSRNPSGMQLIATLAKHCVPVFGPAQRGDVLAFTWGGEPQHLGVHLGDDYIVHAHAAAKKVVKHRLDDQWRSRITAVYRVRESING